MESLGLVQEPSKPAPIKLYFIFECPGLVNFPVIRELSSLDKH